MESPSLSLCACCSKKKYAECCQPLHEGVAARNAEALMRSRYSAYVLGLTAYIKSTWHVSTLPHNIRDEDADKTQWLGLKVKHFVEINEHHAQVEFVARYKIDGRAYRLHECSRFVCEEGRWLYVSGYIF